MVAVKFEMDTKDLANLYDEVSISQFNDGCVLLEKLALRSGSSVLDVGCGTGMLGRQVIKVIGETGQYFGIDPSSERIAIACRKNSYQNAVYQCGKAEDLSFISSNSIDVVYLNWVFHWVLDKSMVLAQIFRVLKPSGKLGITIPCKELSGIVKLNSIVDQVLRRDPYKHFVKVEQSVQKQNNLTITELIQL
ncbi:class I SAM-dependent methyltransferase [bacterium BFN5]|nr:class I SAM-dependent methyltransferase [bacterium BFN5]